jgi:glycosyltransferase involved in cell wall biosynthesis
MLRIVLWQNMPSPHMSAWVRALAATGGVRVTVIVECETSAERAALGWPVPDFGRAAAIVCRDLRAVPNLIRDGGDDAVHVVSGVRGAPLAARALSELTRRGRRVGVISEAADGAGWRGFVRGWLYRERVARLGRALDYVLAMGSYGTDWYQKSGCSAHRLFPFTYVTEQYAHRPAMSAGSGPTALIYVGRFLPTKGPDILLEALGDLRELDWTLTMIGSGPLRECCCQFVRKHRLSERVRFVEPLRNESAVMEIGGHDLLVLPSRHDGWGAVANEALMQGVPVICSDRCGARDLVTESWRGDVFRAGSVEALAEVLAQWIVRGKRTRAQAEQIRQWSQCIGGEEIARYFLQILHHVYEGGIRPVPSWRLPSYAAQGIV